MRRRVELQQLHGEDVDLGTVPNAVLVVDYGDVRAGERARGCRVRGPNGRERPGGPAGRLRDAPGVIVMDVSMPVLDGIEATRLIKAVDVTREARVIAYTGSPSFDADPARDVRRRPAKAGDSWRGARRGATGGGALWLVVPQSVSGGADPDLADGRHPREDVML